MNPLDINIEDHIISKAPKKQHRATEIIPKPAIHITQLKTTKPLEQTLEIKKPVITPKVNQEQSKTILFLDKNEQESIEVSRLSNPFISVFGKANFQSGSVVPEIGIDLKIAEKIYSQTKRNL